MHKFMLRKSRGTYDNNNTAVIFKQSGINANIETNEHIKPTAIKMCVLDHSMS